MNKLNYLKRLFFLASSSSPVSTYLRSTTDIFEGYQDKFLFQVNNSLPDTEFEQIANSDLSGLQKLMLLDFENILPSILLIKMDIATMANSQEGRSPLLCKGLLEYVPSLRDNLKIKGSTTKYLLRKLSEKYLPFELINQPKRGFEVPLQQWVNVQLRPVIGDYLLATDAYYKKLVDGSFVQLLIDNKVNVMPEKRAKMLWLLFTLEVWYQKVYKRA